MNWLVGGVAVYGMAVGGLYLMQDGMIFPRDAAREPRHPLHERIEIVRYPSDDGHVLIGGLARTLGQSRGLLIGFTGNAWNAQDCLTFMANRIPDWDIAVFHYRGYGPSGGKPSQQALFADALMIHDRLTEGLKPRKTMGVGFSLGSGVVSYMAAERDLDGQLLVTPFDSIAAIAKGRYWFVPVNLLLKHPFRSIDYQARIQTPAAVILASNDKVVPHSNSEKLIASLAQPVFVETLPGSTHGSIYDMEEIDELLRRAIRELDHADEAVSSGMAEEVEP